MEKSEQIIDIDTRHNETELHPRQQTVEVWVHAPTKWARLPHMDQHLVQSSFVQSSCLVAFIECSTRTTAASH
jgi:hypothetical protein